MDSRTKDLGLAIESAEAGLIPYDTLIEIFQAAIDNGDILLDENRPYTIAAVLPLIDNGLLERSPYVEQFERLMNDMVAEIAKKARAKENRQSSPASQESVEGVAKRPKGASKHKRYVVRFHAGHTSEPASASTLQYWYEQGNIDNSSMVTDLESGEESRLEELLAVQQLPRPQKPAASSTQELAPSPEDRSLIVSCSECGARLRLRTSHVSSTPRCPRCGSQITAEVGSRREATDTEDSLRRYALVLLLIGVPFVVFLISISTQTNKQPRRTPGTSDGKIQIDYANLVDTQQLTQSGFELGEQLGKMRGSPHLAGEIQPLVEPFSQLLIDVNDAISGPSFPPFINLADHFPPESVQPAWAALLRAGRFVIAFDGANRALVFVPGTEAESGYKKHYGVLRHILMGLVPPDDSPLSVEVRAFHNDYAERTLILNPQPYYIESSQFAVESGRKRIDITALRRFFELNPTLEGAHISSDSGLVLFGVRGRPQTLAGRRITLGDLAVAYRAAAHAGDNSAFVSLDPHQDPTRVTVNFGGFLEDTAIGRVVLDADTRFKTITSGLDANTHQDVRDKIRGVVDGFRTASEREIAQIEYAQNQSWTSTRFWFYPDDVQIETDPDSRYARISAARFLADAERSRDDFSSDEAFEAQKRQMLAPAIRDSIDHMNEKYIEYSKHFPELRELDAVAGLMGISAWLASSLSADVDLDALLSVLLEPCETERSRTKLVSATSVVIDTALVGLDTSLSRRTVVTYLTPILQKPVEGHFRAETAARFLALKNAQDASEWPGFMVQAREFIDKNRGKFVREIVLTERDLQALASEAASRIEPGLPPHLKSLETQIDSIDQELEKISGRLRALEAQMGRSTEAHNRFLDDYNRSVNKHNQLLTTRNEAFARWNAADTQTSSITSIGGGVDLTPDHFDISVAPNSPYLRYFRETASGETGTAPPGTSAGSWVRSEVSDIAPEDPTWRWGRATETSSWMSESTVEISEYVVDGHGEYWLSRGAETDQWRDQWTSIDGSTRERILDSETQDLHIVDRSSRGGPRHFVMTRRGDNAIIIRNSQLPIPPTQGSPPAWAEQPVVVD